MAGERSQHQVEAEVLGGVLIRAERWPEVAEVLRAEHFEGERHRSIFRTMDAMHTAGDFIDAVSVAQRMVETGQAGKVDNGAYITQLANDCTGANTAGHARAMRDQAVARQSRRVGQELAESNGGPDARERALQALLAMDQGTTNHEHTLAEALRDSTDDLMAAMDSDSDIRGITTGFSTLDSHLSGFNDSDLVVLGARPAMGKTSLLLQMALAAAGRGEGGVPVGLISAEQPSTQVAQRHQSAEARVPLSDMRAGKISDADSARLISQTMKLKGCQYWIYDRSNPSISEVIRVARKWRQLHGIRILYVDYLQRLRGAGDGKTEQVGDIAVQLKNLARDLEIPVVALAQVNREVEKRNDKRPGMADLRNSGEIEQEADQILTLYRDEVYHDDSPDAGIAEIAIEKNRHGYIGTVRTKWTGAFVRFDDLDERYGD